MYRPTPPVLTSSLSCTRGIDTDDGDLYKSYIGDLYKTYMSCTKLVKHTCLIAEKASKQLGKQYGGNYRASVCATMLLAGARCRMRTARAERVPKPGNVASGLLSLHIQSAGAKGHVPSMQFHTTSPCIQHMQPHEWPTWGL